MLENREFKWVPASKIHSSSILPPREYASEVAESVKSMGIQQALIVRLHPSKPGEYEIIDGRGRLDSVEGDQLVLVDIRPDAKDMDVFRISETTFKRRDRSVYETARFYAAWMHAFVRERGTEEGAQAILAQQANLSESAISQYLAINKTFEKLESVAPDEQFDALKHMGVNKLYSLCACADHPELLLEVAREVEAKGDLSPEEITNIVDHKLTGFDEVLKLLDDAETATPEARSNLLSTEYQERKVDHKTRERCVDSAKKISVLATETNQTLSSVVEAVLSGAEKFASLEISKTLVNVLQTLRRLKRHVKALREKVQTAQAAAG